MLYKCYIIVKVTHKIENYIIQFNNKKPYVNTKK